MSASHLTKIHRSIEGCNACARLRAHCTEVARLKRRSFAAETYWGKPVPGFGDPMARLLVVGLAPAAHGANRTGRIFTGDRSGEWLYRELHSWGFANQPHSVGLGDGLKLHGAYVSCAVRCAPPGNKPSPGELMACRPFLAAELSALSDVRAILVLGAVALSAAWPLLVTSGGAKKPPRFEHGAELRLPGGRLLLMSYHPSQQNTFTGKLTRPMFSRVFQRARTWIDAEVILSPRSP